MKKLMTEWRKFLNERIMYHSTSPENAKAILAQGLEVGRSSAHTQAGEWADEHYGTRPIYLSTKKGKYEGVPLAVNTAKVTLVADLPTLVDHGANVEEETLWWNEGEAPEALKPYLENGEIQIYDLLKDSGVIQAAINTTGTAAALENIPPENISKKESDLGKAEPSAAESDWASKSQEEKDARWKRIAFETIAMKRYRTYAQAEGIPFDPDDEEDMKTAIAWWTEQSK
jgi:hypothetical protein